MGGEAGVGNRRKQAATTQSLDCFALKPTGPKARALRQPHPHPTHHEEVVDDGLGLARELGAQLGVLRRDADGARVGVALAHHDAAERDERRSGEAKLLGAQQRGHGNVAARAHLAVRLQRDRDAPGAAAGRQQAGAGAVGTAHAAALRWRNAMAAQTPLPTCSTVLPRRSLATSVWWLSARPSSQGRPAGGGRRGGVCVCACGHVCVWRHLSLPAAANSALNWRNGCGWVLWYQRETQQQFFLRVPRTARPPHERSARLRA